MMPVWDKKRRSRRRKEFKESLKGRPCEDCTIPYPFFMMEWDHVPERGKKLANITTMLGGLSPKSPVLLAELLKCDYVCANCHSARTHRRACKDLDCGCRT